RRRHTSFSRDWSSDVCSSDLNKYYSNLFFSSEYNTILLDNSYKVTCTNTGISRTNRFPYDKIQIKCTEQSFLGRISLYQRTKPRSEERRVGKEGRTRRTQDHY